MVAKPESVIGAKGAIQTMKKKQKTTAEVQAAIFRREHRKSPLRGGVKLTLKKARELALQEFGKPAKPPAKVCNGVQFLFFGVIPVFVCRFTLCNILLHTVD